MGPNHELYTEDDFTEEELHAMNTLVINVIWKCLSMCKRCGQYEAGLDAPCKRGPKVLKDIKFIEPIGIKEE